MSVALISHPACLLHDMGWGHPEQPERVRVIAQALDQSGLDLKNYAAPRATREQLVRAHDPKYVDTLFQIAPKDGMVALDPDTIMNPHTLEAALRAAGATIQAVDLVMQKEVSAAFCNVRPPGHHAEKSQAMGFCFFNNIAIAVLHALEQHKLKRVAIIDFDVHHGNGTEDIFRRDPRVMLCSSFQHPFYPFSGAQTHNSHILNLPLPAGTTGKEYREKVRDLWFQAVSDFKPEMIFFSAGFDAHASDELANLKLQAEDYAWITKEIKQIADRVCAGRMVSALEGGYALEVLGQCALAHVGALCP
ncbi:MAG: histone deacetylase family protein [Gammaproteobacteria bacterium]